MIHKAIAIKDSQTVIPNFELETVPDSLIVNLSGSPNPVFFPEEVKSIEEMAWPTTCPEERLGSDNYTVDLDDLLAILANDTNNNRGRGVAPVAGTEPLLPDLDPVFVSQDCVDNVDKYFTAPPPYRPPTNQAAPRPSANKTGSLSTINLNDLYLDPAKQNSADKGSESTSLLLKYLTSSEVVTTPPKTPSWPSPLEASSLRTTQKLTYSTPNLQRSVAVDVADTDLPDLIQERPVVVLNAERKITTQPTSGIRRRSLQNSPNSHTASQEKKIVIGKRSSLDADVFLNPPSPPKLPKLDLQAAGQSSKGDVITTPDVISLLLDASESDRMSSDNERHETPFASPTRNRRSRLGSRWSRASDSRRSTPSPTEELARRQRNNDASRRSRQARRKREEDLNEQLRQKEIENKELQRKVEMLEGQVQALKQLWNDLLANRVTASE